MTRNFTDAALRRLIGFNNLNNLYTGNQNFPPYNIVEIDEDQFVIEMAIAGYDKSDVDVFRDGDKLTIRGKVADANETSPTYVYQGIAKRAFESQFALSSDVEVGRVSLENGILNIHLKRDKDETVASFEIE